MTATRFPFGEGEVLLVSTVQGLVSERERVTRLLDEERPTAVALGLSPEAAGTLLRYERDPEVDPFEDLPDHDFIYSVKLREFGDVDLPPPDLLGAARWAQAAGVTCYGVDIPEEAYEELFTKTVSAFGLLRYGRIQRKLAKRPPAAADARAFSLAWDAGIRRVKGIARVEAAREEHMARAVRRLASEQGAKVVLVVDAPREAGIRRVLSSASG
ncbi:MAG TPA: hypothetical protein VM370_04015 [Candidatus Thermoplasmatota archaeon]|nr:hypothetical protein [Candidatus Thermoplasmatota archaeon]